MHEPQSPIAHPSRQQTPAPHGTKGTSRPQGGIETGLAGHDSNLSKESRSIYRAPPRHLRGRGPQMAGGLWFLASGVLLIAGVGALLAAVALATSDVWHIGDAGRPEGLPRMVAGKQGAGLTPVIPSAALGAGVTLLLSADGPIGEHHMFWLQQPRRLVVDMMGVSEAVAAPVTAPHHPLIRRVRWGRHDDRVRFVIEVGEGAQDHVKAAPDGASLAITLFSLEPSR